MKIGILLVGSLFLIIGLICGSVIGTVFTSSGDHLSDTNTILNQEFVNSGTPGAKLWTNIDPSDYIRSVAG